MGSYVMAVWSSAKPGRDDEYNEWYDKVHIADICAIPGVTGAKRYEAIPASPAKPDGDYLAMYELELDDPTAVLAEIGKRGQSGQMKISDAIDSGTAKMMLLKRRL